MEQHSRELQRGLGPDQSLQGELDPFLSVAVLCLPGHSYAPILLFLKCIVFLTCDIKNSQWLSVFLVHCLDSLKGLKPLFQILLFVPTTNLEPWNFKNHMINLIFQLQFFLDA